MRGLRHDGHRMGTLISEVLGTSRYLSAHEAAGRCTFERNRPGQSRGTGRLAKVGSGVRVPTSARSIKGSTPGACSCICK